MNQKAADSELFAALFESIKNYSVDEKQVIQKAFNKANLLLGENKRSDNYGTLVHSVNVAKMLCDRRYDGITVAAALLHELPTACDIDSNELRSEFGNDLADIIAYYHEAANIPIHNKQLFYTSDNYFFEKVDNYRKLLLSSSKDIRVVIIKLFDRLCNIMSLKTSNDDKQRFYAIETIEIYAAIAERVGLGEIKRQLEDFAFPHAYREDYKKFNKILSGMPKIDHDFIDTKVSEISKELKTKNIKAVEFQSRIKHKYSIYKKLRDTYNFNLNKFHDLYALRIIAQNVADCYQIMGIIHGMYAPVQGRIYDMIAEPKANGYQSLHTTLIDPSGKIFEVQIRTEAMHQIAEYGPAAHWNYKESGDKYNRSLEKSRREWLGEMKDLKNISDKKELYSFIKNNLFSQKIFVFSPAGDIFEMPCGATVLDFAFRIHSRLGQSCAGAKINGTIASLDTPVKNSDVIEIISSNRAKPNIDWLKFAQTSYARQKIKKYLRDSEHDRYLLAGKEILAQIRAKNNLELISDKKANELISDSRLPYNSLDDLLVALANKIVSQHMVMRVLYPNHRYATEHKQNKLIAQSAPKFLSGIAYELAKCCNPGQNDKIIGYIGRDHIIKVHRKRCKFVKNVDPNRLIFIDPFDSAS